jgi:hypothetical protein
LERATSLKRQLIRLNYELLMDEFNALLFYISCYIFSTWSMELHCVFSHKPVAVSADIIDKFGDVDLFLT